jgi:hypothetical protein
MATCNPQTTSFSCFFDAVPKINRVSRCSTLDRHWQWFVVVDMHDRLVIEVNGKWIIGDFDLDCVVCGYRWHPFINQTSEHSYGPDSDQF